MVKVSVILPVYNVENYLRRCLDSILAQTYVNIEVILVDDGSCKDDTPQICNHYAACDPRVKVVHKQNGGLPKARCTGVSLSTGDFVYFVDADDFIEPDAIESLVALIKDDVDIVASEEDIDATLSSSEYGNWFLHWNAIHVWGKLYRRTIVENHWIYDFDRSITVAEDFLTNLRCLRYMTGNVVVTTARKYHYRQLPMSMVHQFRRTPEYDMKVLREAVASMSLITLDVGEGWAIYQIGMLEHFICWRYDPDPSWVKSLGEQAKTYNLDLYHRLILKASDSKLANILVLMINPLIRVCKRIKRTLKWRVK